jgi:hypothetical protein
MSDELEERKKPGPKPKKRVMTKEQVAEAQANHESMAWFEVFEVEPRTDTYQDFDANELRTVVLGFTLSKKHKSVFIEPDLVNGYGDNPGFNHFAFWNSRGYQGGNHKVYLEPEKYKLGDYIEWALVSKMLGFLKSHPNNRFMVKYLESKEPA